MCCGYPARTPSAVADTALCHAGAAGGWLVQRGRFTDAFWVIFDTTDLDHQPGHDLVAVVQARIDDFETKYKLVYRAAATCLLSDRQHLTTYLRFPAKRHTRIRHSNLIERTFGEMRRRVKVIGRVPGEAFCLSLVWAVLDRASRGWRGFARVPQLMGT